MLRFCFITAAKENQPCWRHSTLYVQAEFLLQDLFVNYETECYVDKTHIRTSFKKSNLYTCDPFL